MIIGLALTVGLAAGSLAGFDDAGFGGPADEPEELASVSTLFSVSSAEPGKSYQAAVVVEIVPGWHINSSAPLQDFLIPAELEFDTVPGLIPSSLSYPPAEKVRLGEMTMSVYSDSVLIKFQVAIEESASFGDYSLPLSFTYQACNDKVCRAPETEEINLNITVGPEGAPVHAELFDKSETDGEPIAASVATVGVDSDLQKLIDNYGLWGYLMALGIAFVTGLLLSFSPCTYPMIPITVSIFAGQQRSVGRGFVLSLVYVGTMAVLYGIMGLIVSLVGGVFGAWLASPAVVIGIVVVFVVFSLSMFGLYELQVPQSIRQKLGTTKTSGGVGGAMVLGVVAALVVSPCVGPFVAGILLYVATSGSPAFGFLVLFVFALGLGTLYVLIGTFSSAINALPGSGEWMVTVKKFFGFVLLLMALYFLRTLVSPSLTAILTGLLLVAFGVFGGGLDQLTAGSSSFLRLKKFLGILAFLIGGYLLIGSVISQGLILPPASEWMPTAAISGSEAREEIAWETDLQTGLARALNEGKPVLIDTWATWCVNCKVLEKKTFGNAAVIAEARRFVPIKVQLEKAGTPSTIEFMDRFGMKHYSLPTTLLLDSKGNVQRIMRGVVGPEDLITYMGQVR